MNEFVFELVISTNHNNNKIIIQGNKKAVQDRKSHYDLLHSLVQSNVYMVIMIKTKIYQKLLYNHMGRIKVWEKCVCFMGVRGAERAKSLTYELAGQ